MVSILKNNGLSIVLFALFVVTLSGQYVTGWIDHNQNQVIHNQPQSGFVKYAGEGHFLEALFENWESEFLQMAAYVILTVFLFQKGSSESKQPDKSERVDKILKGSKNDPEMPWPVRTGGFALIIYKNSLSIALVLLFWFSFIMHGIGGASNYNAEQIEHGLSPVSVTEFIQTSTFWFESFQNWQSEFLSIFVMVVFTIFLRQQGSPESKPVDTPNDKTGTE
jgi:hypothetical protein